MPLIPERRCRPEANQACRKFFLISV